MNTHPIFTLCVRHYFDRVNGNSYYSLAVVHPDGEKEIVTAFSYGHGDSTYRAHAFNFLRPVYNWSDVIDTAYLMPYSPKFVIDETNVTRRKDLHNGGK